MKIKNQQVYRQKHYRETYEGNLDHIMIGLIMYIIGIHTRAVLYKKNHFECFGICN